MNHLLLTACLFLATLSSRDRLNAQHTFLKSKHEDEIPTTTRKRLSSRWGFHKQAPLPLRPRLCGEKRDGVLETEDLLVALDVNSTVAIPCPHPTRRAIAIGLRVVPHWLKYARRGSRHFVTSFNPHDNFSLVRTGGHQGAERGWVKCSRTPAYWWLTSQHWLQSLCCITGCLRFWNIHVNLVEPPFPYVWN